MAEMCAVDGVAAVMMVAAAAAAHRPNGKLGLVGSMMQTLTKSWKNLNYYSCCWWCHRRRRRPINLDQDSDQFFRWPLR